MYSGNSLLLVLSDDNALSESKTVSLDNSRIAVLLFKISYSIVGFSEDLVKGCRDIVLLHELL